MSDEIDPHRAVEYLIAKSGLYAQAKANRSYIEQFRKSKKALLMTECPDKAVTAREQYAYAHPDYVALLDGLKEAIQIEEELRWKMEAAKLRIEVWRTQEASARVEGRATQ